MCAAVLASVSHRVTPLKESVYKSTNSSQQQLSSVFVP